jgi:predicted MFS family arabinose efflux permease
VAGTPRPLAIAVLFVFGLGAPLGIAPVTAMLTARTDAASRPQVIAAFFAISSAGTPAGAALTGWAIARGGFETTYAAIAAGMTAATLLLVWCFREARTPVAATAPS